MNKKIDQLFHNYKRDEINRRDFLKKLTMYAGSAAAALYLLPLLEDNYVKAALPPEDDTGLFTEFVTYPGETGDVKAFLPRPKKRKKYPAVIVIHENRGLQPHIQDVNR